MEHINHCLNSTAFKILNGGTTTVAAQSGSKMVHTLSIEPLYHAIDCPPGAVVHENSEHDLVQAYDTSLTP
jgi:hypothetical protein